MVDYRNEIMFLIEECLHKFAEQRINELGIQQSWKIRLAAEVKVRYADCPTDYMLLHRFLDKHSPDEIDLKNLDTTAMCALFINIPDFKRMCNIPTAQKYVFTNHMRNLKTCRNAMEHYTRGITPEQHRDFFFDQLNALFNISSFAALVNKHCPANEVWNRIILKSTQLERRLHWEKWLLPDSGKDQVLYSDDNLSDILFAAESGDIDAQIKAGKIYYHGRQLGNGSDYDRAFLWFSKAAIKDDPEVKYYLACCLENNYRLHKYISNSTITEELIEESAQQGFAPAQYRLGHKYFAEQNNTEAEDAWDFKWTKLAADQNYAPALWTLSLYYYAGKGVKKDYNEYYRLSHLSSELGYSHATLRLGEEAEAKGNYEEALNMYHLAKKQGNTGADPLIKRLERKNRENRP